MENWGRSLLIFLLIALQWLKMMSGQRKIMFFQTYFPFLLFFGKKKEQSGVVQGLLCCGENFGIATELDIKIMHMKIV